MSCLGRLRFSEGSPDTASNEHQHATNVEPNVRSPPEPSGQRFKRPANVTLPNSIRNDNSSLRKLQDPSTKTKNLEEAKLHFIKAVHSAIIQKFNSYGVVLVLLATITFSAILAPPGNFDSNGIMRPPLLLGCFLFFSTLSFFLACTGLLAVISGTASMFRPGFFLNVDLKFPPRFFQSVFQGRDQEPPSTTSKNPKEDEELDDLKVLASLVQGFLHRANRLRVYLVSSLLSCVVAFVCGAFASMDRTENRNRSMLAVAVAVGGVTMGFEILKSATGLSSSYSGKWYGIFRTIPMLPETHHNHWEGAVSRILRSVADSVTPRTH